MRGMHRPPGNSAFSLLELLVVLTILGILTAISLPAVGSLLRGWEVTQDGQLIRDQLEFSWQKAISSGLPVEVRFYQYGDLQVSGETAANPGSGKYRALQLFQISASGSAIALTPVRTFSSVIIDSGNNLSPLLGKAIASPGVPTLTTGAALNTPVSSMGTQYNAVAFQFLPDGTTNLPQGTSNAWFLTVHDIHDTLTPLPRNFCTIEIDATTGHIKEFRP